MQQKESKGLSEESEIAWILPAMTDESFAEESDVVYEIKDTQPGLNSSILVPKVGASFFRCRRIIRWLHALESCSNDSWVRLSMLEGPPILFAVSHGAIVSMPKAGDKVFMDEEYLNACSNRGHLNLRHLEAMFVRLLDRAVLLEFEERAYGDIEDWSIEPVHMAKHIFEDDHSSLAWMAYQKLHEQSKRWWLWRRIGSDFHLARHVGDTNLSEAVQVLEGVKPLIHLVGSSSDFGNIILSADTLSWHMCWDDEWLFLSRQSFTGTILWTLGCIYDAE